MANEAEKAKTPEAERPETLVFQCLDADHPRKIFTFQRSTHAEGGIVFPAVSHSIDANDAGQYILRDGAPNYAEQKANLVRAMNSGTPRMVLLGKDKMGVKPEWMTKKTAKSDADAKAEATFQRDAHSEDTLLDPRGSAKDEENQKLKARIADLERLNAEKKVK